MRLGCLFTACAFSVCAVAAHAESETTAPSFNRAQSVINAFQVMCTLELPKFDAIAAKATAMRMQLQSDNKAPGPGGTNVRQKVWGGGAYYGTVRRFPR